MPPVRLPGGRASRACAGCRKGKTRCYPSPSGSCLRCATLNLECDLLNETSHSTPSSAERPAPPFVNHDCAAVEERLANLERSVERISAAIRLDPDQTIHDRPSKPGESARSKADSNAEAPLQVIRAAASEAEANPSVSSSPETVIDKGYLSVDEVNFLLTLFRRHYRRWIAFRENDQIGPDLEITNSPFLLCTCCLIAVRHWDSQRAREIVDMLFDEVKLLLSRQLLVAPQPLAFFQAVILLSFWSTTVGQRPLSIDSWLISGYAIQHGVISDVFRGIHSTPSLNINNEKEIGSLLLWNRLCLAHMHACISMRRPAMINHADVDRIRNNLPPGELSNYEMRMVAEVNLYWTLYENVMGTSIDLPQAQAALQSWRHVWGFLFDQARPQFIQMGFHFAQLLIFEQSLNKKSAAVRESLISEMVRLCSAILQVAMETSDERTKHLTDHVYHLIAFAAITLCRLLCKYEPQLQRNVNTAEYDALISTTARWLLTLGSTMHVGHTFGNLIDAIHRKLRRDAILAPVTALAPDCLTPEYGTFPGVLGMGMENLQFDWDAVIPDWQSFASDELAQYATRP